MRAMADRGGKFITFFFIFLLLACSSDSHKADFTFRLSASPTSLDPAHATDAAALTLVQEIFDGLVQTDPLTGKIAPCVADSWSISPDGKTYTFHIKPGVKFHNQRRVCAQDFKFSFERALHPKTRCPRTWVLEPIAGAKEFMAGQDPSISGVTALDSFTLQLILREPFSAFLSQLAMEIANVVPREEAEKWGDQFRFHPCGCGPYRLERFVSDVEAILSAFAEYHDQKGNLRRIRFSIVPNDIVAYEQYKSGAIDFLSSVPSGQAKSAADLFPGEFHQWPILELRYLGLNMEKSLFQKHPKLRQALSLCLDRRSMADLLYEGTVHPACRILPPGIPPGTQDSSCVARDVKKAKALLAQEGFPGGKGLPELILLYNSKEIESRLWQFAKSNLEDVGFKIKLKALEWGSYLDAVRKGECDLFRGSWVADYADAHNFLYVLFYSQNKGAAGNYSRYQDEDYDRVVAQAKSQADDSLRLALYEKAETILRDEMPVCPLFYGGDAILLKKKWKGFVPSAQGVWAVPLNLIQPDFGQNGMNQRAP